MSAPKTGGSKDLDALADAAAAAHNGGQPQAPQVARAPRSRSIQACVSCRRQKMKCDGRSPCARCVSNQQPCEFDSPVLSMPPGVVASFEQRTLSLEARLAAIESRQAYLEHLLSAGSQNMPPPSPVPYPPSSLGYRPPMPFFAHAQPHQHGPPPMQRPSPPMQMMHNGPPLPAPRMSISDGPPSQRMNLTNLLGQSPQLEAGPRVTENAPDPPAKRRRTLSPTRPTRMADVIDKGLVSEAQGRALYTDYLEQAVRHMPYLWSVPATFEDARAHSPIFIAATLAVASRIAPENNELNARLGRESMDLVLDFLCADVTTLARSGSATPGDLEGCVVLASFYTLARLAIPILQSAKALGLHRAHQDIVENKVERGSVEEGVRVSRVRLYLQCLTFCATFSHAIGVPSPTLETAESIDNLVGILRRNPAPSDDVLETACHIGVMLSQLMSEVSPAGRLGPPDWTRICDRVEERSAWLEARVAYWQRGVTENGEGGPIDLWRRHGLEVTFNLARQMIHHYSVGRLTDGRDLLANPRRLEHAMITVETALRAIERVLDGWTYAREAWLVDTIIFAIGAGVSMTLSIALVLPDRVDLPRIHKTFNRLIDAFGPVRTTSGFVIAVQNLVDKLFAFGGPAAAAATGGSAAAQPNGAQALDGDAQRWLSDLLADGGLWGGPQPVKESYSSFAQPGLMSR